MELISWLATKSRVDLIETIKYRNANGIWYVRLALVMPDHVHLVVWFPEIEKRVQTIISKWKEWTAKTSED